MSDSRRRIEALRAKADSTTFPAEAHALRAKADELEASLPPEPVRRDPVVMYSYGYRFYDNTTVTTTGSGITITFNT